MLRNIGLVVLAVGGLAALVGVVMNALPHPDANIGAGLLLLFGLPVAGIGLVLTVIGALARRRP